MMHSADPLDQAELEGLEAPKSPEAWVGRLRYVIVPVVAVLAIVSAIYVLGDNGLGTEKAGASSPVNISQNNASNAAPRIGYAAPDFTLNGLDGKPTKLSDFRGKTVFLNFFASWCPPCRAEMPDIVNIYEQNKDSDVVVLGVNMQEDTATVSNYAASTGMTFPIVLDKRGDVSSAYRITSIPTSFFIDKDGVVRDMQIGAMSNSMMANRLRKAK